MKSGVFSRVKKTTKLLNPPPSYHSGYIENNPLEQFFAAKFMNVPLKTSQTTNQVDCHFKPKMMLICTVSNKNDIIYRSYIPYAPWSWHICLHLPYIPATCWQICAMHGAYGYSTSVWPQPSCLGGTSPGGFLLLMLLSQLTFHNAHLLQDLVELSKVSPNTRKPYDLYIYISMAYMHLHLPEIWAANW